MPGVGVWFLSKGLCSLLRTLVLLWAGGERRSRMRALEALPAEETCRRRGPLPNTRAVFTASENEVDAGPELQRLHWREGTCRLCVRSRAMVGVNLELSEAAPAVTFAIMEGWK